MIAGRRARTRPLIRAARSVVIASSLFAAEGMSGRSPGNKTARQDGAAVFPSESMKYLQQLSTLQAAGLLTDEEVSAAKRRLLGS